MHTWNVNEGQSLRKLRTLMKLMRVELDIVELVSEICAFLMLLR